VRFLFPFPSFPPLSRRQRRAATIRENVTHCFSYLSIANIDELSGSVCLDVINQTWSPMFDMINIFEVFLPQLLRYPNAADPLNGEAAALLMRDPKAYDARVKGASFPLHSRRISYSMPSVEQSTSRSSRRREETPPARMATPMTAIPTFVFSFI
jgi:hypothetical protein